MACRTRAPALVESHTAYGLVARLITSIQVDHDLTMAFIAYERDETIKNITVMADNWRYYPRGYVYVCYKGRFLGYWCCNALLDMAEVSIGIIQKDGCYTPNEFMYDPVHGILLFPHTIFESLDGNTYKFITRGYMVQLKNNLAYACKYYFRNNLYYAIDGNYYRYNKPDAFFRVDVDLPNNMRCGRIFNGDDVRVSYCQMFHSLVDNQLNMFTVYPSRPACNIFCCRKSHMVEVRRSIYDIITKTYLHFENCIKMTKDELWKSQHTVPVVVQCDTHVSSKYPNQPTDTVSTVTYDKENNLIVFICEKLLAPPPSDPPSSNPPSTKS